MESRARRSEEHTSELQSRLHLVCRLLLEKKKIKQAAYLEENQLPPEPREQLYGKAGLPAARRSHDRDERARAGTGEPPERVFFFLMILLTPRSTLFPYTTLFR